MIMYLEMKKRDDVTNFKVLHRVRQQLGGQDFRSGCLWVGSN